LHIFASSKIFLFLRTTGVGHLSNLPCNALNTRGIHFELGMHLIYQRQKHLDDQVFYVPVANLFLLRESLYPVPCSSMSTPDRVLPSLINCTARVEGFEGPFDSSNFALRDPAPGPNTNGYVQEVLQLPSSAVTFSTNFEGLKMNQTWIPYLHFQIFLRCHPASKDTYSARSS